MNRIALICLCAVLACAANVVDAGQLSDSDLLDAALAKGKDAPEAGKLGTYKGRDIIVEEFGDIRIIRYDVTAAQCDDVGGVVRTVATPTGQTSTLQQFCVPGVLMGETEEPKKETR